MTTAAQRKRAEAKHQGALEDQLLFVWMTEWRRLRYIFRTDPDFHDVLEHTTNQIDYVNACVDWCCANLYAGFLPIITQAVSDGHPAVAKAVSNAAAARTLYTGLHLRPRTFVPSSRLDIPEPMSPDDPLAAYASDYHIEAAETITADLVTYVSDSTKGYLQEMLGQAIRNGFTAPETGKWLANYVGLFPRWQKAVYNLYQRMEETGTPAHVRDKRAADYADELIDRRGQMIARTELMRAMNGGRAADIQDRAEARGLDPDTQVLKTWVAAPDACPECQLMGDPEAIGGLSHGASVVGIDTPFPTPFGAITTPPLHPHCRCTVNYEFIDVPEQPSQHSGTEPW